MVRETAARVPHEAGMAEGQATASIRPSGLGPVVPRPEPRGGRIGPFRLHQLVLVEVAVAVLLLAWVADPLLTVPAGVVAAALVLLAVAQRRQRPVPEWLAATIALRRRKRLAAGPIPSGTDPEFAPVVECDPSLRTYTYTDERRRRSVGMTGDGTFLTAVLRVEAEDVPLRPSRTARSLPLGLLGAALDVDGIRLESVQVVQHTRPAPAPYLPAQAVAARSYAALQEQSGAPAVRLTWIALKLDPELCPEAVQARGGGLVGAQRALVRVADQLASRLTGAGFKATLLSERELIAAVATSAVVNPLANAQAQAGRSGGVQRRTLETSRAWRCDDRWHTTYWIGRWPRLGPGAAPAPNLVALLTSLPTLASTFALTVSRGTGGGPALTGYLRVTGRNEDELTAARRRLERMARGVKAGLMRLDHEQLPGVLATLPLGGTC